MGLSGLLDHTAVIHELLAHPAIDLAAQVARRGWQIARAWPTDTGGQESSIPRIGSNDKKFDQKQNKLVINIFRIARKGFEINNNNKIYKSRKLFIFHLYHRS